MGERSGIPAIRVAAEVTVLVAVVLAALVVFSGAARTLPLGGDEPNYVARGRYFGYLFVQHDLAQPEWGDGHDTHTQPMLANYVVGGWLWAHGYDLRQLGEPLRAKRPLLASIAGRSVTDDSLLWHARQPMILISAAAIGIVYLLGRVLRGTGAGIVAAAIATASPLARSTMPLAGSEAPLMLFLLIGLLLIVLGLRHSGGGLPMQWAVPVGLALGLALASKLSAAVGLQAGAAWAGAAAVMAGLATRRAGGGAAAAAWRAARGWLLAIAVALLVFVASDPHLYPNPPLHIAHLAGFRAAAMQDQQVDEPEAVHAPLQRPRLVVFGTFVGGMPLGSRGVPLEAVLSLVGAVSLLAPGLHPPPGSGRLAGGRFLLLTALIALLGESALLLVAYPRYWLPSLLMVAVLAGMGATTIADATLGRPGVPRAVQRISRT